MSSDTIAVLFAACLVGAFGILVAYLVGRAHGIAYGCRVQREYDDAREDRIVKAVATAAYRQGDADGAARAACGLDAERDAAYGQGLDDARAESGEVFGRTQHRIAQSEATREAGGDGQTGSATLGHEAKEVTA